MPKDGVQMLQPTALAIKQAPSSSAFVNIVSFPQEVSITLRHLPQPEHLAKSCGRSKFTTYHAYLVNSNLNSKTFIGTLNKVRSGTFHLIVENVPLSTWDQLVVSLAHDDPSDLGMPLFTITNTFSNTFAPMENQPTLPAENVVTSNAGEHKSMLLQPGTVLPEGEVLTNTLNTASSSNIPKATINATTCCNLETPDSNSEHTASSISPIVINELANHALWLINYQGLQLVGYVYDPSMPKKPLYIVHGVPGDHNQKAKPKDQGYDYWVANPSGKSGYWLRYVNPHDNHIAYPSPIK